jgi:hypothetical protein
VTTGKNARDSGTALALANAGEAWHSMASDLAFGLFNRLGRPALFEEVRVLVQMCMREKPPSPNAWGALVLSMSRQGLIERTGEWRNCRSYKSHACTAPLWRIK